MSFIISGPQNRRSQPIFSSLRSRRMDTKMISIFLAGCLFSSLFILSDAETNVTTPSTQASTATATGHTTAATSTKKPSSATAVSLSVPLLVLSTACVIFRC